VGLGLLLKDGNVFQCFGNGCKATGFRRGNQHFNQSTPPQVGLGLLLKDGNVFRCYDHIHLTMFHSELGASKAVLDAGYNIDTLMMRCVSGLHQCTKP